MQCFYYASILAAGFFQEGAQATRGMTAEEHKTAAQLEALVGIIVFFGAEGANTNYGEGGVMRIYIA